jgi:hypothetical protein
LRRINTFQEEVDRQVLVPDDAQGSEEKSVIIERATGRIANCAWLDQWLGEGVEFPESSRDIRKTSNELEII